MENEEDATDCCVCDFCRCREFYRTHTVKEDPMEYAGFISFWCITIGIFTLLGALVTPRHYTFDVSKPAREMESIEQFYSNLGLALDICSILGMGIVTLGALLMANATVYAMCKSSGSEEPDPGSADFRRMEDVPLQTRPTKTYGSGSHPATMDH